MGRYSFIDLFTTADKILFLISVSFIIFSYVYFWQSTPANYAIVKSLQQKDTVVELTQERTLQVKGELGISTFKIENNKIRFIASPCKNKICIQSGWHQHNGSVAACLPNKIILQLASHSSKKQYDAIIF